MNAKIFFVAISLCAFSLTACSQSDSTPHRNTSNNGSPNSSAPNSSNNQTQYFTVTFNSNGGSDVPSQRVEKGGKITKPENPTKDRFSFVNWTYQGEEWSFDTIVESDIALVAEYVYTGFEDYYDFDIALSNGRSFVNKGEEPYVTVVDNGESNDATISYSSSTPEIATIVSNDGQITAYKQGTAIIRVTVTKYGVDKSKDFSIAVTDYPLGDEESLSTNDSVGEAAEKIAALERYALDSHLAGIPIAENSKFVKFSDRLTLAANDYIPDYGFGLLGEATINSEMQNETSTDHKMYLHSSYSLDPRVIDRCKDNGDIVAELESYITCSYWDKKLNSTGDGYVWYPVLAKDEVTINGQKQSFDKPIPIYNNEEVAPNEDPNPSGLYNTYRVYLKTGAEGGIKFRYCGGSWGQNFDGMYVTIDDYEFTLRYYFTYGTRFTRPNHIKGTDEYAASISASNDSETKQTWDDMKASGELGIKTGNDSTNGDYIQITFIEPVDRTTAMSRLSSKKLSPLSEEFIRTVGEGSLYTGAQRYGMFNNNNEAPSAHRDHILDYTLSVGPYMLEEWLKNQTIVFKKNDQWNEPGRYNIAGVKLVFVDKTSDSSAEYNRFNYGNLDYCDIPIRYLSSEVGQPRVYRVKGNSMFKLAVNACSQEKWDELFGTDGKICKDSIWNVKPWMSNDNFLNGLFYSINRKEFADKRGLTPSINFFPDSFMVDKENGISYNSTDAHKEAIKPFQTNDSEGQPTYGYSKGKAIQYFQKAVKELAKNGSIRFGTKDNPTVLNIEIWWMYQTDEKEYGEDIEKYFKDAFNDLSVCNGRIVLRVIHKAVTNWQDVYNEHLMKGQFDLGFQPDAHDMESYLDLMTPYSQSFEQGAANYSFGADTSSARGNHLLIYNESIWSFDTLLNNVRKNCRLYL